MDNLYSLGVVMVVIPLLLICLELVAQSRESKRAAKRRRQRYPEHDLGVRNLEFEVRRAKGLL